MKPMGVDVVKGAMKELAGQVEPWPKGTDPTVAQVHALLFYRWLFQKGELTEYPTGREYAKYHDKPKAEASKG